MPEENELSMYNYLKVISKRKWLIIIGISGCILTAATVTFFLPVVYETRATLVMEGPLTPHIDMGLVKVPTGPSLDKFFNYLPNNRDLNLEVIKKLELDKSPEELTSQALSQMLTFSLATKPRMITINARYSHPQKARDIANTMAEEVKEHYQVLNKAEIAQSQALIDEQLDLAQTSLGEAEKNLEASRETVDVDSLKKEIQSRVSQETKLTQEYSNIRVSLVQQEAGLATAQDELQKQDKFYSEGRQINPVYVDLEETVAKARISIAGVKAKESFLKQEIEENKLALSELQTQLAEREPEWNTLAEGRNLAREEYQSIRSAHQLAEKVLAAAKARQLKTVSTAGVPSSPIELQTKRILFITAIVGLLAVLFLAFFLEYLEKMRKLEADSKKQNE